MITKIYRNHKIQTVAGRVRVRNEQDETIGHCFSDYAAMNIVDKSLKESGRS